jgi:hypothetical protein
MVCEYHVYVGNVTITTSEVRWAELHALLYTANIHPKLFSKCSTSQLFSICEHVWRAAHLETHRRR